MENKIDTIGRKQINEKAIVKAFEVLEGIKTENKELQKAVAIATKNVIIASGINIRQESF